MYAAQQLTEYAQSGNVILTDSELKILALSRNVTEGEGQEAQKVGLHYSLESRQNFLGIPDLTQERVRAALVEAVTRSSAAKAPTSKPISKPGDVLRKCLALSITELPPILVDHILQANNFDTSVKPEVVLEDGSLLNDLTENLRQARELVESITSPAVCTGFIFAKKTHQEQIQQRKDSDSRTGLLYEDFHPFVPTKFEKKSNIELLRFQGYNKTVDEFFSSLEGQKLENRLAEREAAAQRKLDSAKQDQVTRIKGLKTAQSDNFRKAAAIEANIERVQEAMDSINGLLRQGMDWVDIGKLVEREQKKNNPVANLICLPLNLADNIISVRLSEEEDTESEEEDPFETDDSDEESVDGLEALKEDRTSADRTLVVEVVLTLSPWSNAREYYDQRRTAVIKEEKTQLQADKAIKSTEEKIKQDLKRVLKQEKALLQPIRNLMWFEKFYWFISSDGYLVVGAKDKSQAEILYRRHLRTGDVFCHADANNAAVVVVKNNPNTAKAPIAPATLAQAGQLSVCSSEAWDSKAGVGAWWVTSDQVSKSTATGDILQPGNFNISGEKNFLPPGQLMLGLSVMFKISEESKARHNKHRVHEQGAPQRETDSKSSHAEPAMTANDTPQDTTTTKASDESNNEGNATDNEDEDEEPVRANPLHSEDLGGETTRSEEHKEQTIPTLASLNITEESDEGANERFAVQSAAVIMETRTETKSTATAAASSGIPPESKKLKRGQRGKAKKIAAKYKDQDEEDRAAAEVLIGSAAGKQKAEAEVQAKLKREQEMEHAKARRREQHEKKQKEVVEHEERRRAVLDHEADDEEEQQAPIDLLVGTPHPGDEILEAVVVCAPWAALGRSKYKFKLQPGPVKKGKAVKELLERWRADASRKGALDETSTDMEKMWPREVELIKFMKPEEIVNTVPAGRVRLVVVGANSGSKGGRGTGGGKNQAKGGKKGK
ncbi:serologically defined colon cancer antigen 1 [Cordyceps fumosorosea ARSEF 2679]|uniref:Serologically defined colon cancer antigen 1 n=1 Tax=Cordyceps fumosorosea (strain ARSEF 2679) TaxID=1081104 RepID=A0A162MXE3_CORFA|nr:serologically defined colon cancer antigen 1 [Cordyceps fumosorosea ARSEF 2679]OAA72139.1 serologically defined colon cancer antigen 1 [Cordyceps fumosorosea ARSEF 2679]